MSGVHEQSMNHISLTLHRMQFSQYHAGLISLSQQTDGEIVYTENMSEEHQAYTVRFYVLSEKWTVQLQLHCRRWITRRTSLVPRPVRKIGRGYRRTTGKLLSAWNNNFFMHIFMHVLSSEQRKLFRCVFCTFPLVLNEQTGYITATKLVWTVLILNGSEASVPLRKSKALKMHS